MSPLSIQEKEVDNIITQCHSRLPDLESYTWGYCISIMFFRFDSCASQKSEPYASIPEQKTLILKRQGLIVLGKKIRISFNCHLCPCSMPAVSRSFLQISLKSEFEIRPSKQKH